MAEVSPALVKELRARTGLGVMDCKKALVKAGGDIDLAIEQLRKDSGLKAARKASRVAAEGLLAMKLNQNQTNAVMIEINVETDFAARNQQFTDFVAIAIDMAYEQQTEDVQALLDAGLEEKRQLLVQEIGEHVQIRRIVLMAAPEGTLGAYLHTNKRVGALVQLSGKGQAELGKDIAMHITSQNPLVINAQDVAAELVSKEREIYVAQAKGSGKPDHILEKIVEGRVRKYLNEISLTEQPFVKDTDKTIKQLLNSADVQVLSFQRFEVGEGIAQQTRDFASEVAAARSGA